MKELLVPEQRVRKQMYPPGNHLPERHRSLVSAHQSRLQKDLVEADLDQIRRSWMVVVRIHSFDLVLVAVPHTAGPRVTQTQCLMPELRE